MPYNLYVIAEGKEAALKVAKLIKRGKLPNIYKSRDEALHAHAMYPRPAQRVYSPYEIPRLDNPLTQCTKIFA